MYRCVWLFVDVMMVIWVISRCYYVIGLVRVIAGVLPGKRVSAASVSCSE